MALIKCPECDRSVSSAAKVCSACGAALAPGAAPAGQSVEKKPMTTGTKWLIGCGIAAGAGCLIVPVIGMLAAIAIPSFVKARSTSQQNMCINNLRMIDSAKEQWAMAENKAEGDEVDIQGANQYIRNQTTPTCVQGGTYTYNKLGEVPTCSLKEEAGHQMQEWR